MSKENNYHHLAQKILELCGGKSNISSYTHCMTRLRITPYDESKADAQGLRKLDGVLGVVEAETLQIILGTGVVNHVTAAFSKLVSAEEGADVKEARPKRKPISIEKTPLLLNFSYVKLPAFLSLLFPL